jgi:hypothetical protein
MLNRNFMKVTGHSHLVRDVDSNGILNVDNEALDKYKQEREERLRMNTLIKEHDGMRDDIASIKRMLLELLGRDR